MRESLGEALDEGTDLVADAAVVAEGFFLGLGGAGQGRRVVKADMNDLGVAGKKGAGFVGMAADGDDIVKGNVEEVADVFGVVGGDIHAGFGHDADGAGIEAVGFDAGGIGVNAIGLEMARPAFGHLAAAGVAGAKKQDTKFSGSSHDRLR